MKLRIRCNSKVSQQQPVISSNQALAHKRPTLQLPSLRRKSLMSDNFEISQNYIKITQSASQSPQSHLHSRISTQKILPRRPSNRYDNDSKYLGAYCPIEDRIHQKQQQNQQRYQRIVNYVKWKNKENHRKKLKYPADFLLQRARSEKTDGVL